MTTTQLLAPRPTSSAPGKTRDDKRDSPWYWLFYGVSAALLTVILGIAVIAVAMPRLMGAVPLTVLSSSMEPTYPPGTMLVVRPLAQDQLSEIRIGDVISFMPNSDDDTLVTHRVIGIRHYQTGGYTFTTQGDANANVDAPVHGFKVRAKVLYGIPWLGWVNNVINQQGNRAWIIPTAAGLLFAYGAYTALFSAIVCAKEKKRKADEEGDDDDAAARKLA